MKLSLQNSLSEKKEILEPLGKKPVRLFVCGPTVYDYLHIGNARTYLVFDAFAKYLRASKIKVYYLQNITDIDDKIIIRAEKENTSAKAIAAHYQKIYLQNMKALGVTAVDTYAPATKYISEIVRQVETLIQKGHVYKIENDGYYFDISSFPDYGKLAHRTVAQAEDGVTRIDESVGKKNKGDFCVWKFSKPNEPSWKTKLGVGRPGWHIEDTAISEHFFGPQYDIHGGGIDLKFPHHEAEIAQQESASGKKPLVKIWMHVGALTLDGKKMSKSLGNIVTINNFLEKYPPQILRLISLTHHYRSPINYTDSLVNDHIKMWRTIEEFIAKLEFISLSPKIKTSSPIKVKEKIDLANKKFQSALADDFNTPTALASLFELMNDLQPHIWKLNIVEAKNIEKFIKTALASLGFLLTTPKIPAKIKALAKKRDLYRSSQHFTQADALRIEVDTLGYVIEDTPRGAFVVSKV